MSSKVQHIWTLLCQRAIIDKKSNNLSLVDVVETVKVPLKNFENGKIFKILFPCQIVSFWSKDEAIMSISTQIRLVFYAPGDKKISQMIFPVHIASEMKFARSIINLNFLPITVSGEYILEIQQQKNRKYEVQARVPFLVNIEVKGKKIPLEEPPVEE